LLDWPAPDQTSPMATKRNFVSDGR
jgi:hypothetical protein